MSVRTPTPTALSDPREGSNEALTELPFASDLRVAVGRLIRGLRAQFRYSLAHTSVLGRLEREGAQCIGELANAERVRPQSMSQTLAELESAGLIARSPDETDGRRTKIDLTQAGREALYADRAQRDGWLAQAISDFTEDEQRILEQAVPLLMRLSDRPLETRGR